MVRLQRLQRGCVTVNKQVGVPRRNDSFCILKLVRRVHLVANGRLAGLMHVLRAILVIALANAAPNLTNPRAMNRVVPAYPNVRLSPATLEMLASRPSMKPRAEVAAHLLSPEHASDHQASWPRQPTRGVVTFQVCGGLTNQRLALLDGLMVAALLNFTAIAPQLNTNGL